MLNNVVRFQLVLIPSVLFLLHFYHAVDIRTLGWEEWWNDYQTLSFFLGMGYIYYLALLFWIPQDWSRMRHRIAAVFVGPVPTFFVIWLLGYPALVIGVAFGLVAKLPAPRLGILVGGRRRQQSAL
jgi:hypothetical protein